VRRLLPLLAAALAVPAAAQEARDEKGLWMQMAEAERTLAASDFVIRDPALNAYVRGVLCRQVGPACADVRLYVVRTPYFNASMAPNGMMTLWSGLFLRVRDEAQLAAVLGHEFEHFRQRHSLRLFRDVRAKTDAFSLVGLPIALLTGGMGYSVAQAAMVASVYGFSREMEREADAGSVPLLRAAGYDPAAASVLWGAIQAEREASAAARGRKPRGEGGPFASHPTSAERLATLKGLAAGAGGDLGRDRYRAALAPHWAWLVDDQVKLGDFGGTELLLARLAEAGWTGELLYARAELYRARGHAQDFVVAAGFYRQAIAAGAPPEAQRGLGLALLRQGERDGGQAALSAYLKLRPDAPDAAMIRQMAGQP
jgi:Zn-dependent protease with chaperone function